jgi:hypothetical protein
MSVNKGGNEATINTGTSVEASAPITTTANPSTDSKPTAPPSNISKETIAVEAAAPTTTNTTIIASDLSVKEMDIFLPKDDSFMLCIIIMILLYLPFLLKFSIKMTVMQIG